MKILLAFFLFTASLSAKIVETFSFEEVAPLVEEKMWIIIDLDNTLFQAKQALGHADWFYHQVMKFLDQGSTRDEAYMLAYPGWIKTQKRCPVMAIEQSFVDAIHAWQKKGVHIMGLTGRHTTVVDSTLAQVKSLGLDFSLTAPSQETFAIEGKAPMLYKGGVIFASDFEKKGDVFLRFLKIIGKSPEAVAFFDDREHNVEDVEVALKDQGIEVLSIYYRAVERTPKVFDPKLAEVQMRYLDSILSNEAAEILLQNNVK